MTDIPRLGKQPPRYTFFLNPCADARFTSCPKCGGKTRQKKLPLVIHVDKSGLISLNKTCRFCPACDLLVAHQDEVEAQLAHCLRKREPEVVGNDCLMIGTLSAAPPGGEKSGLAHFLPKPPWEHRNPTA